MPASGPKPEYYIGLMSGTSLDGVDGVIADFAGDKIKVVDHFYAPFEPALRTELLALNTSGLDELHRAALAENGLARTYAKVVAALLQQAGKARTQIQAIGVHGQTVRHRPQMFDADPTHQVAGGYTLQLNNPALLAELTGLDVVADFRRRDVAAGGQGAPLVPAFHRAVFGGASHNVAVINIGGISNISLLYANTARGTHDALEIAGYDCGPGNALIDHWCQVHTGRPFDDAGQWAASGQVHTGLLASLLDEAYFHQRPPKSTGRDLFNVDWLTAKLAPFENLKPKDLKPVDVQATLTELTARVCCDALRGASAMGATVVVCGGGALNAHLMARLAALSGLPVASSELHGLPPLQVEAAAFAWLARQCIKRETSNVPKVTGAQGARILGAIYPA